MLFLYGQETLHIMATMQEHLLHVLGTCSRGPFTALLLPPSPPLPLPPSPHGHVQTALENQATRIVLSGTQMAPSNVNVYSHATQQMVKTTHLFTV